MGSFQSAIAQVPQSLWLGTGLAAGGALSILLWRRAGQSAGQAFVLLSTAAPLVLLGGKLLYLVAGSAQIGDGGFSGPGFTLYGGLFLVLLFWAAVRLVRPFPLLLLLDCVTPGAAVGLVFARLGCFSYGCCAGSPCLLPWAARFPSGSPAYVEQVRQGLIDYGAEASLPVHPIQLYEAFFGLVALLLLLRLFRRGGREGDVFLAGVLWYSSFRFLSDGLRMGSPGAVSIVSIPLVQFLSLVLILTSAGLLASRALRPPRPGRKAADSEPRIRPTTSSLRHGKWS